MTDAAYSINPLGKEERSEFDCGSPELNQYFHRQISQDVRRKVATAFVAKQVSTDMLAGFYTLAGCHVDLSELDADWQRRLPRYPTVPAVLVGRLAVDNRFRGQGLGAAMLVDAAVRALASPVGMHLLVAEAKNETAAAFYSHQGMRRSPVNETRFFVPLTTIAGAITDRRHGHIAQT
jgi:GNAT superfamily N-acetyltransferase